MFSTPNTRASVTRAIASFAALVMVYSFAGSTQAGAQAGVARPRGGQARPVFNNPNLNRVPVRPAPSNSRRNGTTTFQNSNGTFRSSGGTTRQIPNHPSFPNRTFRRP